MSLLFSTRGQDHTSNVLKLLVSKRIAASLLALSVLLSGSSHGLSQESRSGKSTEKATGVTSLTNSTVTYRSASKPFYEIERGGVSVVVVANGAVNGRPAPGHRAGYNGVAAWTHEKQPENLFVPSFAGLNFEHIHDGTSERLQEKFEPRKAPMELRVIDRYTVELYQAPTPNWRLESCGRYQLLQDGTLEYTFECIPRAETFSQGYIGLFWASYIQQPEDKRIHFVGHKKDTDEMPRWITAETPKHGVDSTHPPASLKWRPSVSADFPLTLVNHPSSYVYDEPWYYGIRDGMAFVQMFRSQDNVWFAQSPTGGGADNPAWDFQWFIPDYQVGQTYRLVMRAAYLPTTDREAIEQATRKHRRQLNL